MLTKHEQKIMALELGAAIRQGKETDVIRMRRAGYTKAEIAHELGLNEYVVHCMLKSKNGK